MNLLIDMPFHQLNQRLQSKRQGTTDKKCELLQFSVYDLLEMIGDGNCHYTGKPFINPQDVTFERVNPTKGYVKGNVVMVSVAANGHKALLDNFVKRQDIPDAMKVKLLRKAIYQLEKVK